MKKVFIIHGFRGEPNGSWKSWLMWELGKLDIYACSLPMPTPDEPKKSEWVKTISNFIEAPNEDIYLVGHSLGVPAVLHYLESLPNNSKIGGAILVSGAIHKLEGDKYRLIDNFFDKPFDFEYIKKVCKNFCVIHGDNDVNVPFAEHAVAISKSLNCKLISIHNGGHLSSSSGWYELPEALQALEEMMK